MSDRRQVVASLCGKTVPPHSDARFNMTVAVPERYFCEDDTDLDALRRYLQDDDGWVWDAAE